MKTHLNGWPRAAIENKGVLSCFSCPDPDLIITQAPLCLLPTSPPLNYSTFLLSTSTPHESSLCVGLTAFLFFFSSCALAPPHFSHWSVLSLTPLLPLDCCIPLFLFLSPPLSSPASSLLAAFTRHTTTKELLCVTRPTPALNHCCSLK